MNFVICEVNTASKNNLHAFFNFIRHRILILMVEKYRGRYISVMKFVELLIILTHVADVSLSFNERQEMDKIWKN